MQNEIRYFSMFTGVGGFELGISRSCGDVKHYYQKENSQNSNGNKPISEGQQTANNQNNIRNDESSKDSSGTLFQNGQEQSNSTSLRLEEVKENTQLGQSLRQTSNGVLREGDGIRDDKESLQQRENSPHPYRFKCVGFSEIDKYCSELLTKKFPTVKNYGDCTKIKPEELPDFNFLCGGFPCQSFSIAGKRKGFQDTRGTMFFEIARILKVKRPKILLLENVKGLLNHEKGKTFSVILETLDELGYETQWMVLNSKFFGVPQNRERIFIIGNLREESRPEILPLTAPQRLDEELEGEKAIVKIQNSGREMARIYDSSGVSPTLRVPSGGWHSPMIRIGNTEIEDIRRITPLEGERLQGFPDDWTSDFSETRRYRMIGNAVTVNVVEAIASKLFCTFS